MLAGGLLQRARAANGSWRICEKVSIFTVSRRPGDRTWNDLLGQHAECSIDTVHHGTGCDPVAASAVDAAAPGSGNAACIAADAKFAEWLAITRRDHAQQSDAVFPEWIASRVTEWLAIADAGHDRS